MQLKDLVKPLSQMTPTELLEHLRQIRHRRSVERPATKARQAREEKKVSRGSMSAIDKLLAGLSPAERAKLMEQLEEKQDGNNEGTV